MFVRPLVRELGMTRPMNAGDGLAANYNVTTDTTDATTTFTVSAILGGLIVRDGMTANRIGVTPTAALLAAALPDMNIGDTFSFKVANWDAAQTITVAGGTGVTATGNLIVGTTSHREFVLEKTAAATFNLYGI